MADDKIASHTYSGKANEIPIFQGLSFEYLLAFDYDRLSRLPSTA